MKPNLAIIGAGFSGIFLAQELREFFEVKIFEKSRGSGGRMSTRYAENFTFDHGAQYFTAESEYFKKFLDPFIASNTPKTSFSISLLAAQWLLGKLRS